ELAGAERDRRDLGLAGADLDAAASQARIERVVVAVKAQIGLRRHAGHEAHVGVGHDLWQRSHPPALLCQALGDERARCAVHACAYALAPAVELILEVERIGKAPAGLEVAVQEAMAALERALSLAVARIEDDP